MFSTALWFWSTLLLAGLALAVIASSLSLAAPLFARLFPGFQQRARRAGRLLREQAERVSRPPLSHGFDALVPSRPSHPSGPGRC
jgi:hypothetical protein